MFTLMRALMSNVRINAQCAHYGFFKKPAHKVGARYDTIIFRTIVVRTDFSYGTFCTLLFVRYFSYIHLSYVTFRTELFVQHTFRINIFRTNFSYKYFVQVLFVEIFRTRTFRTNFSLPDYHKIR